MSKRMVHRFDNRVGGAYLPNLEPMSLSEVRKEYREQVDGLKPEVMREVGLQPITKANIDGVCECGYVKIKGIPTPIHRRMLTKYASIVVPRKTDWSQCDACVNGYGFDMCGCGSGEKFDKCDGGTDHCGAPMAIGAWGGHD